MQLKSPQTSCERNEWPSLYFRYLIKLRYFQKATEKLNVSSVSFVHDVDLVLCCRLPRRGAVVQPDAGKRLLRVRENLLQVVRPVPETPPTPWVTPSPPVWVLATEKKRMAFSCVYFWRFLRRSAIFRDFETPQGVGHVTHANSLAWYPLSPVKFYAQSLVVFSWISQNPTLNHFCRSFGFSMSQFSGLQAVVFLLTSSAAPAWHFIQHR